MKLFTVSTPATVKDAALLAAWPSFRPDTLETEGPDRSTWDLTGYRLLHTVDDGTRVYVVRVRVNETSRVDFFAARVSPRGSLLVFAADGQSPPERTLRVAAARALACTLPVPEPAHGCGVCDGPIVFDGWRARTDALAVWDVATWRCPTFGCWWHAATDCCDVAGQAGSR